jgi:glutathione S-transferase
MNVNDWYLFHGVANVIGFQRIIAPRFLGLTPDEAAIEAAMPQAHMVFAELARLLGEQPYFAGDAISLADLTVAPQLTFFTQTPEWAVLGAPHANLVAWLSRMEARASFQATTWERVSEMAKAA